MRQSTFCDRGAPPGHPTMDENHKTSTDESASYHASTHTHPTALYTAPYAPSPGRPTPRITSRGGNSKASCHPILIPQISIASQDEQIARCTRSRFPTVDRPPPKVNKKTGTSSISRCMRSQTASMATGSSAQD